MSRIRIFQVVVFVVVTVLFTGVGTTSAYAQGNTTKGSSSAKPKPAPPKKGKTDPGKPQDDLDAELDAIVDEEQNKPPTKPQKGGSNPNAKPGDLDDLIDDELDDGKPKPPVTKKPANADDDELEDLIKDEQNKPTKPQKGTQQDELGDIEDIDDELEDKPKPPTVKNPKPPVKPAGDDTPTDEAPDDIKKNSGQVKVARYAVYVITNASGGLFVGSEDDFIGKMSCDFVGGGPRGCKAPPVTKMRLSTPRLTIADAQKDLCDGISETRIFPLGIGMKGKWTDDKWYGLWDASVAGCPKKRAATQ
ncbi:MAG: hypothetical protein IPM59_10065 [Chloracidobacterium sp.]|nr:hypothetical protein [Chloracidobacterium sp.]